MRSPAPPRQPGGPPRLQSASSTERLAPEPRERAGASLQRRPLVLVAAVEQLCRRMKAGPERAVVRVPPEVARARGLPRDVLHVHALVEAELGVRAAESRLLHPAP